MSSDLAVGKDVGAVDEGASIPVGVDVADGPEDVLVCVEELLNLWRRPCGWEPVASAIECFHHLRTFARRRIVGEVWDPYHLCQVKHTDRLCERVYDMVSLDAGIRAIDASDRNHLPVASYVASMRVSVFLRRVVCLDPLEPWQAQYENLVELNIGLSPSDVTFRDDLQPTNHKEIFHNLRYQQPGRPAHKIFLYPPEWHQL